MLTLSGTTRVCMSLGYPIAQSLSPGVQTAAFQACNLDWVYVPWAVRAPDLADTVKALRASETYAGGNATAPHKEALLALLDGVTPQAARVGAVNVIFRDGEKLIGDTSDGAGYVAALREAGVEPKGLCVLMLGAGGAARAVGLALVDAGVRAIGILNRTPERAATLGRLIREASGQVVNTGPLADAPRLLPEVDLVINATSIGLQPGAVPLFDYRPLRGPVVVSDLAFLPRETPFLRQCREQGCRAMNGLGMLLHQAVLSFESWTRQPAPVELMRTTLDAVLREREQRAAASH
jgi:shikimate dehydrogenase